MAKLFLFHALGKRPDGQPRHLLFDNKAVCDLEVALDDSIFNIVSQKPGLNFVRHCLWVGLKHEDAALTPDRISHLIDVHVTDQKRTMATVIEPMFKALRESGVLSPPEEGPDPNHEVVDLEDPTGTSGASEKANEGSDVPAVPQGSQ